MHVFVCVTCVTHMSPFVSHQVGSHTQLAPHNSTQQAPHNSTWGKSAYQGSTSSTPSDVPSHRMHWLHHTHVECINDCIAHKHNNTYKNTSALHNKQAQYQLNHTQSLCPFSQNHCMWLAPIKIIFVYIFNSWVMLTLLCPDCLLRATFKGFSQLLHTLLGFVLYLFGSRRRKAFFC